MNLQRYLITLIKIVLKYLYDLVFRPLNITVKISQKRTCVRLRIVILYLYQTYVRGVIWIIQLLMERIYFINLRY